MVPITWLTAVMRETPIPEGTPVLLGLDASTEHDVIGRMIHMLADRNEVRDPQELQRAVLERQKLQIPLLGSGIALPHARTAAVTNMVMAIARCREPVPFGPDKVPIRLVFLYGIPTHCISRYLASVARLSRVLKNPTTIEALLAASDEAGFIKLLL